MGILHHSISRDGGQRPGDVEGVLLFAAELGSSRHFVRAAAARAAFPVADDCHTSIAMPRIGRTLLLTGQCLSTLRVRSSCQPRDFCDACETVDSISYMAWLC